MTVDCTRESIRRFVKLYLSLKDTPYWYHQTLTFGSKVEDTSDAKIALKRFLDSVFVELGKEYEVAVIYLVGRQENNSIHFHVLFLFYGQPALAPEALREKLWGILWKRWQKQSPGSVP